MFQAKNSKLLLIAIHVLLGFLMAITPRSFNKIFGVLIFVIGVVYIYKNKNNGEQAFVASFYLVSAEVFLRMTKSMLTWDFGKYAVIIFLALGLLVEKKKRGIPILFVLYLLLISIGIAFTDIPASASYRKAILFNISGPYSLGVAAIYFYKRNISIQQLKDVFFVAVLPMISMVVYLYFRTPSLKEMVFNTAANFSASGGFGPNQVATSIGLGMFLIGALLLLKYKITGVKALDAFLLIYVSYRGLLTFSRGGIITGILGFLVLSFFYLRSKGNAKVLLRYVSIFTAITLATWLIASSITGGVLNNRYLGENAAGEKKGDISTGRVDIIENQLQNFYENPIWGLGVASGDYKRKKEFDGSIMSTSHNEIGRLIEEHGLIGILSLLLLIFSAYLNFTHHDLMYKGFIAAFVALWFLTINHSAMRIAFPGFIYGLSLICIYDAEQEETTLLDE